MKAKITKRVYTFQLPASEDQPASELTIEKLFIIGGPDPSTLRDEFMQSEGHKKFGKGAVLVGVRDFSKEVEVDFPED